MNRLHRPPGTGRRYGVPLTASFTTLALALATFGLYILAAATGAHAATPISRSEVIARAKTWLTANNGGPVPYSQNSSFNGYRQDCSGFVSMAWGLSSEGNEPNTEVLNSETYSYAIDKDELAAGDILIDAVGTNNTRHVVLFEAWADAGHNSYVAIEQAGTPGHTVRRTVSYPYDSDPGSYHPRRYNDIADDGGVTVPRQPLCRPVTGDWDGNGAESLGVACKEGHGWALSLMNANIGGSPQVTGGYGNSDSCLPVTGDWDGNGSATAGVACKSGHGMTWSLANGFSGSPSYSFGFGNSDSCWPVTGDWDGDGADSVGVGCRSGNGLVFNLINSLSGGSPSYSFGFGNSNSCRPVTGDWDGNGTDTVGVACRSGSGIVFDLINSQSGGSPSYPEFGFGNSNSCEPVTGDWNGDGTSTVGVVCRSGTSMTWNLMNIHSGGSPQIVAGFGNGGSFQPTAGWYGPPWPNWPTN